MQQPNRYAPPGAHVQDPEIQADITSPHVELTCRLLWSSLGLAVVDSLRSLFNQTTMTGTIGTIIGTIIGTVIVLGIGYLIVRWTVSKLRAGRNWMRWLYTILNVLGYLAIAVFWDFYRNLFQVVLQDGLLAMLIMLLQFAVGIAMLVLLHTPTSRAWFAAKGTAH